MQLNLANSVSISAPKEGGLGELGEGKDIPDKSPVERDSPSPIARNDQSRSAN